ncbi:hypothetical protein CAP2UW1_1511 [Candidatus Accumulibacter phosphatis]|jgi:hypothetical protein|uniref:Uncharacterized protein n=1 Tax=Accumulibacter regalis TaxID=522306 RepID=C7RT83_ACCRE
MGVGVALADAIMHGGTLAVVCSAGRYERQPAA